MSTTLASDMQRAGAKAGALLDAFYQDEPWLAVAKLLRIGLLSWFFLHTALLVPYAASIWGPDTYAVPPAFDPAAPWAWFSSLLNYAPATKYYLLVVWVHLISAFLAIVGVRPRLMSVLAWVTVLNLNSRAPGILDGGNNLANILLFYLLFMNTSGKPLGLKQRPLLRALLVSVANGAVLLARLQIFAVYFTVAIFKLNGPLWQHGMALYYILQSEQYSHPYWGRLIVEHEWLSFLGTYFTVLFQITFPFLVWPHRTRPYLLLAGIALHIGIATVMGLLTFGLVMCVSYLAFFRETWSRSVLSWLTPTSRVAVALDPAVASHRRLARLVRGLDWLGLVDVRTACSNGGGCKVFPESGSAPLAGADAVVLLLSRLPVFVPIVPLYWLASYLGVSTWLARVVSHTGRRFDRRPFLVVLLACIALLHCSTAQVLDDRSDAPLPTAGLKAQLTQLREQHQLPAIGVYADVVGRPHVNMVLGVRRTGDPTPATTTDQFHFGSDGKAMTATILAMLIEEHKLRWNSTLGEIFPDLHGMHPDFRNVTLEMLLAHRSGIVDAPLDLVFGDALSFFTALGEPGLAPAQGRQMVLEHVLTRQPGVPPGTKFSYSNYGYAIAGAIIDRLTGKSYEEVLPERLWAPLAMTGGCGFGAPGHSSSRPPEQPWGHQHGWLWGVNAFRPSLIADNPPALSSAGRMHCSMADWGKFLAFLRDGLAGHSSPLLSTTSFRKLFTPYPGDTYTYGAWIQREADWAKGQYFTHAGSNTFAMAVVAIVPAEQAALISVANIGGDDAMAALKTAMQQVHALYTDQTVQTGLERRPGEANDHR